MPRAPAFAAVPPAVRCARHRREQVLLAARSRGWLSARGARAVAATAHAALAAGALPDVAVVPVPGAGAVAGAGGDARGEVEDLCKEFGRVLRAEEPEVWRGARDGVRALKGAAVWMREGSFERERESASQLLLQYFDEHVLKGRLLGGEAPRVTVAWNSRLYKTAGVTYMRKNAATGERSAAIELSRKVLDEPARLYNCLSHELCHAAQWIIDDCARPPHGAEFKSWARVFNEWDSALKITTCHDYAIRYKFRYECQACGYTYGRHSRSINIAKQVCGCCKGTLRLHKDI